MANDGGYTCFCGNSIPILGNVVWCDSCIEEFLAQNAVTMDTFIQQKKEALRQRQLRETPPDGMEKLDGN